MYLYRDIGCNLYRANPWGTIKHDSLPMFSVLPCFSYLDSYCVGLVVKMFRSGSLEPKSGQGFLLDMLIVRMLPEVCEGSKIREGKCVWHGHKHSDPRIRFYEEMCDRFSPS